MEWLRSWNVSFIRKRGFPKKTLSSFLKASPSSCHWGSQSPGPWWQNRVCGLPTDTAKLMCPGCDAHREPLSWLGGEQGSGSQSLYPHNVSKTKPKIDHNNPSLLPLVTTFSHLGNIFGKRWPVTKEITVYPVYMKGMVGFSCLELRARERIAGRCSCFLR